MGKTNRDAGEMIDRTRRLLTEEDVQRIAETYHAWRSPPDGGGAKGEYEDQPGFCAGVSQEKIAEHNYVLTPGRYVGFAEEEDDGEPFEIKMERLTAKLAVQFEESTRLERVICKSLQGLGLDLPNGQDG